MKRGHSPTMVHWRFPTMIGTDRPSVLNASSGWWLYSQVKAKARSLEEGKQARPAKRKFITIQCDTQQFAIIFRSVQPKRHSTKATLGQEHLGCEILQLPSCITWAAIYYLGPDKIFFGVTCSALTCSCRGRNELRHNPHGFYMALLWCLNPALLSAICCRFVHQQFSV